MVRMMEWEKRTSNGIAMERKKMENGGNERAMALPCQYNHGLLEGN
jgi:hypothetical protein